MPVRKFRSVEEMEGTIWRPVGPELWRSIRAVWGFAVRTCPRSFPHGVFKHRDMASAQRQRDEWEEANFRELWRRRGQDPPSR